MGFKRRIRHPVQLQPGTSGLLDRLIALGHQGGWRGLGVQRPGAVTKAAMLDECVRRFAATVDGVEA